jgi:hypothetical protein
MIVIEVSELEVDDALFEAIAAAKVRVLRRAGAETRQAAAASIKPGKGASRPGEPPHDRTGILKRFIRYAVNESGSLVIVGPMYLQRMSQGVPAALERGGVSVSASGTSLTIKPRPFMAPAFDRMRRQVLPRLLTDAIH